MTGVQMLPAWPPPVLRRAIGGNRANIATDRASIASSTVGTMMPRTPMSTARCTLVSVASGIRRIGVAAARGHAAIIFSTSSKRSVECCISNREKSNFAAPSLSQAFVDYARDQKHDPGGIIYVDPQLKPQPPSAAELLSAAARAPSLSDYVQNMGWMSPIYAKLRAAIASRLYGSDAQRRILELNLERARALPSGNGRYVIVNPPAARLYMYENGQVVDSMRVVAGRPDPVAQTPMMNAYIRYVALNPYWNSPPDITSRKLAPTILKEGRAYFTKRGYDLVDHFGPGAHVLNPMSVDWRAVAAGRLQVNLRQRPGPANSMGKMKFMFPNQQGIWLHDTPEKEKIEDAARLQSNGCVRLEAAPRLERWLFNGRPPNPKGAAPEQKVNLPELVPLYITYLTAVPSGTSIVYFDDFYGKDRVETRRFAGLF